MENAVLKYIRQIWKSFCRIFLSKKNLKRDVIIMSALVIILANLFSENQYSLFSGIIRYARNIGQPAVSPIMTEEEVYQEVKAVQSTVDAKNWKTHQSRWYGFEIKYPEDWADPINRAPSRGAKWEYLHQFRKYDIAEGNPYIGFDLMIYDVSKIKELANTEEFPALKNEKLKAEEKCANIEGHIIETGDYPAEEIYIPPSDDCYSPALFFSNTRGAYIYNIVPKFKEGSLISGDPRVEIMDDFPEFYSVVSTFKLTDIIRPRPVSPERATFAPMPVSYKVVRGQLVCAKENDHPSKSKKNNGRHLDMECCLDPDEYPNPHCYYPSDKYGKYLK